MLDCVCRQILEGLLKLPENKECADCKAKYVYIFEFDSVAFRTYAPERIVDIKRKLSLIYGLI